MTFFPLRSFIFPQEKKTDLYLGTTALETMNTCFFSSSNVMSPIVVTRHQLAYHSPSSSAWSILLQVDFLSSGSAEYT